MPRYFLFPLGLAGAVAVAAACSATSDPATFEGGSGGDGGAPGGQTTTSDDLGGFNPGSTGSTGSGPCAAGPDEDFDHDGYSISQGDCNDCDANTNPGAVEVIVSEPVGDAGVPEPTDEDCDGTVDNPAGPCDADLALDDPDPLHAAWAVDLCEQATADGAGYGVLSAAYVRANGTAASASSQVGIMDAFGMNVHPRLGTRLLGLSTGRARTVGQPDACGALSCYGAGAGSAPPGFPQDVPNCGGSTQINDDVGLEVRLRAPTTATGFQFNIKSYSFEYPEWVCTSFNDQFISLVSPPPAGSLAGNVSFDQQHNPVSVNVAFFDVCAGCPLGTAELAGTGFDTWDDAGATGWLVTQAPISGGDEFSIRWAIWDTGDQAWDSSALVDGFQWIANGGIVPIETTPVE
ncbi:MAG: choice-of-anchor L domain-containing protein [Polyangiaceae bacterium]|nr:choice-of-anchor L domain-containing protein [Polyangiaceae bacterium]